MQRNTGYFPTESLEPCGNRLFSRSALNEGYLFRGSLNNICSGRSRIEKCSAETLYKLAQILHVTIEDLIIDSIKGVEPPQNAISFELFKSNICHRIKDSGDITFIIETLKSNEIRRYYDKKQYPQAFYLLNSVYTRSGQNGTPNSNATNLHSSQKRCCSFCISSSNASPTFQVQKSIFHQMTKPIQVTVILPLLLAISFSRNDDIHSSISGISNDLIGVIPTIGQ